MPTLELKNVSYAYEKGKTILSNISTELDTGKMYAILGPSGSGKMYVVKGECEISPNTT